jgi:hypothetical protein
LVTENVGTSTLAPVEAPAGEVRIAADKAATTPTTRTNPEILFIVDTLLIGNYRVGDYFVVNADNCGHQA